MTVAWISLRERLISDLDAFEVKLTALLDASPDTQYRSEQAGLWHRLHGLSEMGLDPE
jgi:hypothetical protein